MRPLLFIGVCCVVFAPLRGTELVLRSGTERVSLIELFTSEGCSSCPPAERWLETLRDSPELWRNFVPVAFHVDYWNRLGWPDAFSTRENTQRQYAYAKAWGTESVYTPCFVRDGAEWRGNRTLAGSGKNVGVLTATYDGDSVKAEFAPAARSGPGEETRADFEVHAAILGGSIESAVTVGENRGETLRHEFVALVLAQGALGKAISLPRPHRDHVPRYALAVWITRRGQLTPFQAVGGWL